MAKNHGGSPNENARMFGYFRIVANEGGELCGPVEGVRQLRKLNGLWLPTRRKHSIEL